ncbi:MAG: ABC transporter ATP-binding protein [Oscillospiraceae bacterium]
MEGNILEVRHLRTHFIGKGGKQVRAVDDLSYAVKRGEFTAIIGESGSGKTVEALSILRLIPYPPGLVLGGEVIFEGRDLMQLSDEEMEHVRGKEISMIFQEPAAALNPVLTIGEQITEAITTHIKMGKQEAWEKAVELLRMVDIPNPEERVKQYPFEFSGGMQQRAMIAMAMSCSPKLLICDEPTTALDVTVQAQVLEQINHLRKQTGTTIILITHNLGVVARHADSVKIMYGGRIVEEGATEAIFGDPHHPYTVGLIRAVPRLDRDGGKLYAIEGEPPDMSAVPVKSCAFSARCPYADERCRTERPELSDVDGVEHRCACFHQELVQKGGEGA